MPSYPALTLAVFWTALKYTQTLSSSRGTVGIHMDSAGIKQHAGRSCRAAASNAAGPGIAGRQGRRGQCQSPLDRLYKAIFLLVPTQPLG